MFKGFNYLVMGFFIISVMISIISIVLAYSINETTEFLHTYHEQLTNDVIVKVPFISEGQLRDGSSYLSPFDIVNEGSLDKCQDYFSNKIGLFNDSNLTDVTITSN